MSKREARRKEEQREKQKEKQKKRSRERAESREEQRESRRAGDMKDNIFSIGMVGDYTFDKSVTIGAGVQWRDGLDSGDWGYRGFAAVPLFKGQTSSKNTEIYRPVARMLGAVIQAEEEDCSSHQVLSHLLVTVSQHVWRPIHLMQLRLSPLQHYQNQVLMQKLLDLGLLMVILALLKARNSPPKKANCILLTDLLLLTKLNSKPDPMFPLESSVLLL